MYDPLVSLFKDWEIEAITTEELIALVGEFIGDLNIRAECVEHILLEDARVA